MSEPNVLREFQAGPSDAPEAEDSEGADRQRQAAAASNANTRMLMDAMKKAEEFLK